jgi:hypothetical protein
MTQPSETAALDANTGALLAEADRLGLTWSIRPGTVISEQTVTMDGDTLPINVVSLMGTLSINRRVMVMFVPNGGNYVVGPLGARPSLSVYRSAAFNFAASTWLQIDWDTSEWDDEFGIDPSGSIEIPFSGLYSLNAQIVFAGASNTTTRSISLNANSGGAQGTGVIVQSNRAASSQAGDSTAVHIEKKTKLVRGDTVEVYGFSRSAVAGQTGVNGTYLSIVLLN